MKTAELSEALVLLRMELFILVNGLVESEMAMGLKCGQMVLDMKEAGRMIKLMVKESLFMQMVIFMRASGSMIKLMEKVLTRMLMVLTIMEIGLMISNTVSAWNLGLMVPNTKVSILTVKRKDKASLLSQMAATTKENLSKTRYAVTENISGLMESNMKVNGAKIKCMAKEH